MVDRLTWSGLTFFGLLKAGSSRVMPYVRVNAPRASDGILLSHAKSCCPPAGSSRPGAGRSGFIRPPSSGTIAAHP